MQTFSHFPYLSLLNRTLVQHHGLLVPILIMAWRFYLRGTRRLFTMVVWPRLGFNVCHNSPSRITLVPQVGHGVP